MGTQVKQFDDAYDILCIYIRCIWWIFEFLRTKKPLSLHKEWRNAKKDISIVKNGILSGRILFELNDQYNELDEKSCW